MMCGRDVQTKWADLAEISIQGTFTKEAERQLLTKKKLGRPSWSDDEWQHKAHSSLPAALQYHIWPQDHDASSSFPSQVKQLTVVPAALVVHMNTACSVCTVSTCSSVPYSNVSQ